MTAHFHTVAWIDHREARILNFNFAGVEKLSVHPAHPARHLHHRAGTMGSGHAPEDQGFYARVADALAGAGAILIVGPANAKNELVKYIEHEAPALLTKIAAVEAVDHPTDKELLDQARRHFRDDHQAPLRVHGTR